MMPGRTNLFSFKKVIVISICLGAVVGLSEAVLHVKPWIFWIVLWAGFILGYWLPPVERSLSFRRYVLYSLPLSLIGALLLKLLS